MVKYPTVLPIPTRDGYMRTYGTELRLVKMDNGQSRRRRTSYSQQFDITTTFSYTSKELKIFEAFIKYQCDFGAAWFDLPIIPGKPDIKVRLHGSAPSIKANGNNWDVTCKFICIESGPVPPSQWSMPLWPAPIPLPDQASYTYAIQNIPLEDNIDQGGLAGTRNRFTTKETKFTGSITLTLAERDIFLNFVKNTLLDGNLPFIMPFYNGLGFNPVKCKFSTLPKEKSVNALFGFDFEIVTVYAPTVSFSEYVELIGGILLGDYAIDYFAEDYTVPVLVMP